MVDRKISETKITSHPDGSLTIQEFTGDGQKLFTTYASERGVINYAHFEPPVQIQKGESWKDFMRRWKEYDEEHIL